MLFFSTNKQSPRANFREATIRGQAPDKGLYYPEEIPKLEPGFFDHLKNRSKEDIAFTVIQPYVGNTIPEKELRRIVEETVNFDFPLVQVDADSYSLELFHGPTLAFKDVGARFMSRCLGFFSQQNKEQVTVLVATSGDTGGAVASGFDGVPGVRVVILYPSGKVSSVQELQLTTGGDNIRTLEVEGDFDDCQRLVKQAFADDELRKKLFLTSANSINVARWLPQQFYYFFAFRQWSHPEPPVISVPSGNFGNIGAGLLAFRSGLPVRHFVAACNVNDTVARYLEGGRYQPRPSVPTLSNAMDVSDPSNFVRILEMAGHDDAQLKTWVSTATISDEETRGAIQKVFKQYQYILDPHGAVAWLGLRRWLDLHPGSKGIFLETAHPVKFPDAVEPAIGHALELPASVKAIMGKPKKSSLMPPVYEELKTVLMS